MEISSEPSSTRYYGVDLADDGTLVVAERLNRMPVAITRYPAGAAGMSALRERIGRNAARPSVCIRSCGAATLAIAMGLAALPIGEVTLVAPHAIEVTARASRERTLPSPEDGAQRLARLGERLY